MVPCLDGYAHWPLHLSNGDVICSRCKVVLGGFGKPTYASPPKPNKLLNRRDITHCPWCREQYTEKNFPTRDHVIPKSRGGSNGPTIIVCMRCNQARAFAPYELYVAAVAAEWAASEAEQREYHRPRWWGDQAMGYRLSHHSKSERRQIRKQVLEELRELNG